MSLHYDKMKIMKRKKLTEKGKEAAAQILEAAKEEFYSNGYIKTTIKSITDRNSVYPSWVTYYFKTKNDLVKELYLELYEKIDKRIEESDCIIPNKLLFQFVRMRIIYKVLFYDEPTKAFFYELNKKGMSFDITGESMMNYYKEIANEFNLAVSMDELEVLMRMSNVSRIDFFVNYAEGRYPNIELEDAYSMLERFVPLSLRIDTATVDSLLLTSIHFANTIGIGDIRFLK